MSSDLRGERAGENESLFRTINERVEDLAESLDAPPVFICECERLDCTERLRIDPATYSEVRSHPRRFFVVSGHENPEFERVIDQGPGWLVVEKTGTAGEVADDEAPRE